MKTRKSDLTIGIAVIVALIAGGTTTLRAFELRNPPSDSETPEPRDLAGHDLQIAAYTNALEVDPQSAIALGQLAGLYLQRARETGEDADFQRAEDFARRSLDLRVNRNAKTFVTLASSLLAQHEFAEAEMIARLAVEYDPTIPQYRALLAEVQVELGNYDAAREQFKSVAANRAHLSIASRVARWYELNGNVDEAFRLMRRSVKAADTRGDIPNEQVAWFHYRLADMEMRNGKFRRARKEFERGLEIEPADYRILGGLAKLSLLEDKPDRAIAYAERGIAIKLEPAALAILSEAFLAKGDTAAAEEISRTMDVVVRGQPGAYHRGWSLSLLDHGRRPAEVNRNALSELATRKDIYGYDVVAWSFYRLGRHREAAEYMRHALRLGTRDPVLYYHAGMIEEALGNSREAAGFLRAALKINPRFDLFQARIAKATLDSLTTEAVR